ncbi:hypothetical protein [Sinomonas atrocyanea]|uniref:hypothetical protein n=1 Tax=Sinomonas atrocyanea TaxID=37927 RepID=UPI0028645C63|nr:hypothetical protein [Sinomonas atrocyanea]MDR6623043.1 hypothetical protein [Sinomonas atrocyanea]
MFKITEYPDQNKATASLFKRAATIAGLDLEPFDTAARTVPTWSPATAKDVADAAYKAAAAGKDPATDKDVQRLLLSKLLADQIGGLNHRHEVAVSQAELEHYQAQAPALLAQLRTEFASAVETMTEALQIIGHVNLSEYMRDLPQLRPGMAQTLVAAHTALAKSKALLDAHGIISAAAGQRVSEARPVCAPRLHEAKPRPVQGFSPRRARQQQPLRPTAQRVGHARRRHPRGAGRDPRRVRGA